METGQIIIYLKQREIALISIDGLFKTAISRNLTIKFAKGDIVRFDLLKSENGLEAINLSIII